MLPCQKGPTRAHHTTQATAIPAPAGKENFAATLDAVKSSNSLHSQDDGHVPRRQGPSIPSNPAEHPLNILNPLLNTNQSQTKTVSIENWVKNQFVNHQAPQHRPICVVRKLSQCTYKYLAKMGTSTLRGHIDNWHLLPYIILALQPDREWPIQVPTMKKAIGLGYTLNELKSFVEKGIKPQNVPPRSANGSIPGRDDIPPFSPPIFHKYLVNFIITDDQALSIIEGKDKIKIEIIKAWQDHFVVLKQDLANALGNMSFTANIWFSDTWMPYLAVTAHWIAGNTQTLSNLKMSHFTVNNAKNNHPTLVVLAEAWAAGLDDDSVDKKLYLNAMKKNPVVLGRDIVCVIHASGIQHNKFVKTIATGNLQEWFKSPADESVKVPGTQLLHNIKTRWDSIFYMINCLHALQLVVDLFLLLLTQKDIMKYQMNDMVWFVLNDYEMDNIIAYVVAMYMRISSTQKEPQTIKEEFQLYIEGDLGSTDILGGTLLVFSLSEETDTKKRNQIGPTLMEALQMLKYHLKKQQIDYLANWKPPDSILIDDDPEEPDNTGKKQDRVADVHHSLQDILLNIVHEELEGLPEKDSRQSLLCPHNVLTNKEFTVKVSVANDMAAILCHKYDVLFGTIGNQLIHCLQHIHLHNYIHWDIKPTNVLVGTNQDPSSIYLIDFSIAKQYRDPSMHIHIPFNKCGSSLGNVMFISVNGHLQSKLGRLFTYHYEHFLLLVDPHTHTLLH
ncbi:hypothetical protein OG21DRAFT_1527205 [Imleria badia]|nr:hypothetical protein OG21DRAFT_1527205 [Imleria badia]